MRKLVLFNLISVDGFFEGPNRDISWHGVDNDEEFNEFAIEQLNGASELVFGRFTYQLMESYWPTAAAVEDDPIIARKMNSLPKIVFSRTLDRAEWEGTRLIKGDAAAEMLKLKQQPGGLLCILGSANLAKTFTRDRLIDEYRIMVSPIILGKGTPHFQDVESPLKLELVRSRTFRSGSVLLTYQPG